MTPPDHPLTVKWLLFGFRGRIGRKSFILAALLLLLAQLALFSYAIGFAQEGQQPGQVRLDSGSSALFGFVLLGSWIASAWALLALAVKRLHDLGLPVVLGIVLLIPALSGIAWILLAALPSKQETNEHGPVPFPKD
jgi:uncharacterized membrane protein YhaH (DUF805 family)